MSLQHNAVFENGDLPEALFLGPGLLSGADSQHQRHERFGGLVQGSLAVGDHTGVKVDPVMFLFRQGGVGGDLHRGRWSAEGGAPSGGEEDQLGACRGKGGGGYQVVARAADELLPRSF